MRKDTWHAYYMPVRYFMGPPGWLSGQKSTCGTRNTEDTDSVPRLGRSPGGHSNPLHYSCLENPMDRGAWWVTVYRVAMSRTWSNWHARLFTDIYTCIYWHKQWWKWTGYPDSMYKKETFQQTTAMLNLNVIEKWTY